MLNTAHGGCSKIFCFAAAWFIVPRNSVVYANELRLRNTAYVTRLSRHKVWNENFTEAKFIVAFVKHDETSSPFISSIISSIFHQWITNRKFDRAMKIFERKIIRIVQKLKVNFNGNIELNRNYSFFQRTVYIIYLRYL